MSEAGITILAGYGAIMLAVDLTIGVIKGAAWLWKKNR